MGISVSRLAAIMSNPRSSYVCTIIALAGLRK
jgi:hypothetical protein